MGHEASAREVTVWDPVPLPRREALTISKHEAGVRVTVKQAAYESSFQVTFDPMYAPAVARAILLAGDYINRDSNQTISNEREALLEILQQEMDQHQQMLDKRNELAKVADCRSYADAPNYVQRLIDHAIEKGI